MSVQMEQHERWVGVRERLWPMPRVKIDRAKREKLIRLITKIEKPKPVPVKRPLFVGPLMMAPQPYWRAIAEEVCQKHGVSFESIASRTRIKKFVAARYEAFWRIRNEITVAGFPMSYPEIGRRFGGRDHTTVIHGVRKHQKVLDE